MRRGSSRVGSFIRGDQLPISTTACLQPILPSVSEGRQLCRGENVPVPPPEPGFIASLLRFRAFSCSDLSTSWGTFSHAAFARPSSRRAATFHSPGAKLGSWVGEAMMMVMTMFVQSGWTLSDSLGLSASSDLSQLLPVVLCSGEKKPTSEAKMKGCGVFLN